MKYDQSPIRIGNADAYIGPFGTEVRNLLNAINNYSPDDPYFQLNLGTFTSGPLLRLMADVPLRGLDIEGTAESEYPQSLLSLLSASKIFRLTDRKSSYQVGVAHTDNTILVIHGLHRFQYSALRDLVFEVPVEVMDYALQLLQKHLQTNAEDNQKFVIVNFPGKKKKLGSRRQWPSNPNTQINDLIAQLRRIKLTELWNSKP